MYTVNIIVNVCMISVNALQVYLHFYLTQGNKEVLIDFAENKLLVDQQYSFTSGRSCITQLLTTIDVWMELLEEKKEEEKQRKKAVDVV